MKSGFREWPSSCQTRQPERDGQRHCQQPGRTGRVSPGDLSASPRGLASCPSHRACANPCCLLLGGLPHGSLRPDLGALISRLSHRVVGLLLRSEEESSCADTVGASLPSGCLLPASAAYACWRQWAV